MEAGCWTRWALRQVFANSSGAHVGDVRSCPRACPIPQCRCSRSLSGIRRLSTTSSTSAECHAAKICGCLPRAATRATLLSDVCERAGYW